MKIRHMRRRRKEKRGRNVGNETSESEKGERNLKR